MGAMLCVCLLCASFWAVFEQQGNSMALYVDQHINRQVRWPLGNKPLLFVVPTEYAQSINPVFILAFTPLVNSLWRSQKARGREPSPLVKMSIGCLLLGLGYAVLGTAAFASPPLPSQGGEGGEGAGGGEGGAEGEGSVSMAWLVLTLALATLGELYLSPVGLSFVTKVAPPHLTSLSLGFWFLGSFAGNYAAGWLGSVYPFVPNHSFFYLLSVIAGATSVVLLLLSVPLSRLLRL